MDCTTHALEPTAKLAAQLAAIEIESPDLVLAFLPPSADFQRSIDLLAERWPASLRCGCEAVSQFVDHRHLNNGALLLLSLGSHGSVRAERLGPELDLARGCRECDASLVLLDGRYPTAVDDLTQLRDQLRRETAQPVIVGGLASAADEVSPARVFLGGEILPLNGLVLWLTGVEASAEIFAEWQPAGPFYRVTDARDNHLLEIDGVPATAWFRRFFEVDGVLAPMPEAALPFPLILEGEDEDRRGLFRSMRSFDEASGEVTFWGDLRTGDRVRFGIPTDHSLLYGGQRPTPKPRESTDVALLMSCFGRELLLGDRFEEEAIAMHRAESSAPLVGFTTLGEIGPSQAGSVSLHNQTAVLLRLRERPR